MSALALLTFLAVFMALGVNSYSQKSATWDEPIHLTAGYLALTSGDYRIDPSHPPFMRIWSALPLLAMDTAAVDTSVIDRSRDDVWLGLPAPRFATQFLYRGRNADRLLYAARFMMLLWGAALGILLFVWAREWLGLVPALIALLLYTIEPNIAAHSRLVTTDFGVTFLIFATVYCLRRTCRHPSAANVAWLSACFSLAFVTKFSAIVLVPIVVLLMAVGIRQPMGLTFKRAAGVFALLVVVTYAAIWGAYGFRFAPSNSEGWLLHLQDSAVVQSAAPALGKAAATVDALRLLPNAYTQGFLMSRASARQTAYFAGTYSQDGWWYYFPVAFLMKTPSVLVVLFAAGAFLLVAQRRQIGAANAAFVIVPLIVYFGIAVASGINIGVRHILPVYPFVLLMAALAAKSILAWRRPIGAVALVCLLFYWGERYARVYPDVLTYVSRFVGGPEGGLRYLADSNLDWGQDLKPLKDWMARMDVSHINLAYFGTADPAYYGISVTYLPGTSLVGAFMKPQLPGYVAVSATVLAGPHLERQWRLFYDGLSNLEPVARIGNSIYVYWVDQWPEGDSPGPGAGAPAADDEEALADGLFFDLDWTDHAILHYRRALERDPGTVSVARKLGVALLNTDRAAEAVSAFQQAVDVAPSDRQVRYWLAFALLGVDQNDGAVVHAETAVRLGPDDPAAHDLLGVALVRTGRVREAEAAFEEALRLSPGHQDAREHLARLRGVEP